jgi:Holliday junction resolvase RusA-like endonuclease
MGARMTALLDHAPASSFELVIPGTPEGKDRPRFRAIMGKGRKPFVQVYTTKKTEAAEKRIVAAWDAAGRPRVSGEIAVDVVLYVDRAKGHFTSKGALSAVGLRHPYPTGKKPDVDNALKLVMDALNGHGYSDDVDVIVATVRRVWAGADGEMTRVKVSNWSAPR